MSARRLLGAHLPAESPERRETVAGECLGCRAQFAIDVPLPLPLPVVCLDCGADVPGFAQGQPPRRRSDVADASTGAEDDPSVDSVHFFALPLHLDGAWRAVGGLVSEGKGPGVECRGGA